MSLPPPMQYDDHSPFTQSATGLLNHAQVISDVLSWMPRRIMPAPGQQPVHGSSAPQRYGGRIFYPTDTVDQAERADIGSGFIEAYRFAASVRRRRSEPVEPLDLTSGDEFGGPSVDGSDGSETEDPFGLGEPRTVYSAAMVAAMINRDRGIGAALNGLTNIPGTSLAEFVRRVDVSNRRASQRGRPRHP